MKARSITPTKLLCLCLCLFVLDTGTACSFLPGGGGETQNTETKDEVKAADVELTAAKKQESQARALAEKKRKEADEAKKEHDKAKEEERKKRNLAALMNKAEEDAKKAADEIEVATNKVAEAEKKLEAARLKAAEKPAAPAGERGSASKAEPKDDSDPLLFVLKILGVVMALLVLGLLGYAIKMFIDSGRDRLEGQFIAVKKRQDEYARQTRESLAQLSQEVNNRMAELQSEIRTLRQSLQDYSSASLDNERRSGSSAPAYAGYPSSSHVEEPAFPVPVEDYLNKMKRGAVVVKPDFQNGILVQDYDGGGEFLLVRDLNAPGDLLYVVPRVPYFKTKQDFLTYYHKYYDCPRPGAGTVWLVTPAVVDRVSGGWTLREKGELEVR